MRKSTLLFDKVNWNIKYIVVQNIFVSLIAPVNDTCIYQKNCICQDCCNSTEK